MCERGLASNKGVSAFMAVVEERGAVVRLVTIVVHVKSFHEKLGVHEAADTDVDDHPEGEETEEGGDTSHPNHQEEGSTSE